MSKTSAISKTHNLLSLYVSKSLIIRCLVGCRRTASCCAWISAWALDRAIVKLRSGSPLREKLSSMRFLSFWQGSATGGRIPPCGTPARIGKCSVYGWQTSKTECLLLLSIFLFFVSFLFQIVNDVDRERRWCGWRWCVKLFYF